MANATIILVGAALILVIGIVYFSSLSGQNSHAGTSVPTTTMQQTYTTTITTTNVTIGPSTVRTTVPPQHPQSITFNVTEKEYSITPSVFDAYANQKIIFNVSNNGALYHNFGIWGLGSGYGTQQLNGGGGFGQFQFTTTTPGNYTVYSNVDGDQQHGMTAVLHVH